MTAPALSDLVQQARANLIAARIRFRDMSRAALAGDPDAAGEVAAALKVCDRARDALRRAELRPEGGE